MSLSPRSSSFGDALRELRLARGLTLAEVATAAAERIRDLSDGRRQLLTSAGLLRIETGDRVPGLRTLLGLAYALEVRIVLEPTGWRIVDLFDRGDADA